MLGLAFNDGHVTELLIEPYGIEIIIFLEGLFYLLLLIEPYGIEIRSMNCLPQYSATFNRTLWN